MSVKNFVVKNGITTGGVTLDAASGNITANNANLGNLLNVSFISSTFTAASNAQPNITSVGTLTSLSSTGNIEVLGIKTDNYYYANGAILDMQQPGGSNTQIQYNNGAGGFGASANFTFDDSNNSLSVTGNITAGNVSATGLSGTLSTAAQTSITSVGTLTGLTVNGLTSLGPVGNVSITGGTAGQYLQTDGTGNLVFATVDAATLSNGTSNVKLYNNANIEISAAGNANVFTVTGSGANVTGTFNATGNLTVANANLGNAATANFFIGSGANLTNINGANVSEVALATNVTAAAQGNITSVGTLTSLSVLGNVDAGNVSATLLTGTLTTAAQPNVTSVGVLSSLSVSGNVDSGNLNTTIVSATGNIAALNVNTGIVSATGNVVGANLNTAGTLNAADAVITGNLTVQGNTTYVNVDTLVVQDPVIEMGGGANGAPLTTNDGKDRGSLLHYFTGSAPVDAFMGWDNSNAEFTFGSNVTSNADVMTYNSLGNVRANVYFGDGSQLTGVVATGGNANYANFAGQVVDSTQSNITAVGTLTSLSVSGNIGGANVVSATLFVGSGANLTNINGANVSEVALATNVTGATQSNITAVGTLTSISTTGNITGANVVSATLFSGSGASLTNINGANVSEVALATNVTAAAQGNITSVGTLTSLSVSGNVTSAGNGGFTSLTTTRANVAVSGVTVIDSFATTAFRTAKYVIQAKNGSDFESVEALVIHDGTNAFVTVYGIIFTGSTEVIDLNATITAGNVELTANGTAGTTARVMSMYVID